MNKRNKRFFAAVMAVVTLGTVGIGFNVDNKFKSKADETELTQHMTISECSKKYSAVNYLTRGLDWYSSGSPIYNVGNTVNTAITVKPNLLFSNNDSELATDNWKVKVIEEMYNEFKSVDDSKFANYVEKYSKTLNGTANADASLGILSSSDYSACVDLAKKSNKTNNVTTYYRTIRTSLVTGNIQLDDNADGKHNISKDFVKDAFALLDENSGITMENIIDRYGTHYVQNVQMGGRLQLSYSICSNNANSEETELLKAEVASQLDAKLDLDKKKDNKDNKDNKDEDGQTVEPSEPANENKDGQEDDKDNNEKPGIAPVAKAIVNFLCGKDSSTEATYGSVTVIKEISTVGPMYNGDVDAWYEEVKNKPQCIGMSGEGIQLSYLVNYMTEENTGHTQAEIDELSRVFNKKYNEYMKNIKDEQVRKAAEFDKNSNTPDAPFSPTVETLSPVSGPTAIKEKADFSDDAALGEVYQLLHKGYSLGELKVTNKLVKNADTGCYNYTDLGRMKISYTINKNIKDLPVGDSGALSHELTSSPSNIAYIFGKMQLLGIRKGAYYVNVEYNDGTSEIISKDTNVFKGTGQGQNIEICSFGPTTVSNAMSKGGINKINIVILYNTTAKFTNKNDNCSQDWKTVYTIQL